MHPSRIALVSAFAAAMLLPLPAAAQRASGPQVDRVQLAVADSGGAACPRDAVLTAWAHTTGPGTVRFVIHNRGGGKTGELKADAVAGAAGTWLATYRHTFKVGADTDTEYRAEAGGQYSNWVPFEATCGPRARAGSAAAGASTSPPARGPDSRARQGLGEATDGGGAPPARPPAPETKPNAPEPSGGSSKPNSANGKQCGRTISSTRYGAVSQDGGKATALVGWMAAVVNEYPDSWKDWRNAQNRSESCKRAGLLWNCTLSGSPCEP